MPSVRRANTHDGGAGAGTAGVSGAAGAEPGSGTRWPAYDYATSVENTGADCEVPALPEPQALTAIPQLPDPFVRIDGTRITKVSEWRCRRQEIHAQAEKYVYGEKPKPDAVTGTVTETKITVHVEAEGKAIDFGADVVLPKTGSPPYPALINVGAKGGFGSLTLGESRILEQGVAVSSRSSSCGTTMYPPRARRAARQSHVRGRRSAFFALVRRFSSRRLRSDAAVGRVGRRRFGATRAARTSAASRSRASSRF